MPGRVEGKIALVTGAGSGIGRATALTFAREGAKVAVADMDSSGGEETVRLIKDSGSDATFIKVDVSQESEVKAMVDNVVSVYGRLDCAHNNAGIEGAVAPMAEYKIEDWNKVIAVNLTGVWLCLKHEISQMLKQDGGAIVNTASISGLIGDKNMCAYNASKHGVNGLSKGAAVEYSRQGIRVNSVCPGVIRTSMVERLIASGAQSETDLGPMGRLARPEEIGEVVVWLCSDAASFVTGHTMAADGGFVAE